jgi:hypothetical protein
VAAFCLVKFSLKGVRDQTFFILAQIFTMLKYLQTLFITCVLSVSAIAQNEPPILKIEGKTESINVFKFDDHLNILTVDRKKEGVELYAVNDKMEVVWKKAFPNKYLIVNKFKNRVVLLASNATEYRAILLDPANGTQLADKAIYTPQKNEFFGWRNLFTNDGMVLKLAIGSTLTPRTSNVLKLKELSTLSKLEIIEFDDQLEAISSIKVDTRNSTLINIVFNKAGDMFVGWIDGATLEIDKYDGGKNVLAGKLTTGVAPIDNYWGSADNFIRMAASSTDANAVYYGQSYKNENKDVEFGIGKFDFKTDEKVYNNQVLNKEYLKNAKKAFVPVNKKIDDVDLGEYNGYELRYMDDVDGTIVAALSSRSSTGSAISSNGSWAIEKSILLNAYDSKLGIKFQQFLPSRSAYPNINLISGFYHNKSKMYVVANNSVGLGGIKPVYGALDVNTGLWDKMDYLSRKDIGSSSYFDGKTILWYSNGFIMPYLISGVTMQQYNY